MSESYKDQQYPRTGKPTHRPLPITATYHAVMTSFDTKRRRLCCAFPLHLSTEVFDMESHLTK